MVIKKSGLVITVLGILSVVLSVTYVSSCTKPLEDRPWSCNYVVCTNGGTCDSGKCACPVGFEGTDCSVKTVEKYYGHWTAHFKTIGSDSASQLGKDTVYPMELKASATYTTFFIYNFNNNKNYSNILCKVDSVRKDIFIFDSTMAQNMFYDQYRIKGGWGVMYRSDSIAGRVWTRSINKSFNWQNDTFDYYLLHKK